MKEMNLESLLINKLNALYDIEANLTKALPKVAKAATDPGLKQAVLNHLSQTKEHVNRLNKAHSLLGVKPKALRGDAIRGLIADTEWVVTNIKPEEVRDANLVRAAQYVEHYEIAGYNGAIGWAEALGETEVAPLLSQTLEEEMMTDESLATLGKRLDQQII